MPQPRAGTRPRRFNAVDVCLAAIVLVLIPGAYVSSLVFRTPPPRLTAVFPSRIQQGPNQRVELRGEHLRPFLRVGFNLIQAPRLVLATTESAQVDLPDLAPGVYEIELFDQMEALDKLPAALTVLPRAPVAETSLDVGGSFENLPESMASALKVGETFPTSSTSSTSFTGGHPVAEIVSLEEPAATTFQIVAGDKSITVPVNGARSRRARLRVRCDVGTNADGALQCTVPGPLQPTPIEPGSLLTLVSGSRWVNFLVATVEPAR